MDIILCILGSWNQNGEFSTKNRTKFNRFIINIYVGHQFLGKLLHFKEKFGNMASETPNSKKIFDWFILSYIIINLMIKHGNFGKYFLPTQIFSGN